jgi:hypothetical protein
MSEHERAIQAAKRADRKFFRGVQWTPKQIEAMRQRVADKGLTAAPIARLRTPPAPPPR